MTTRAQVLKPYFRRTHAKQVSTVHAPVQVSTPAQVQSIVTLPWSARRKRKKRWYQFMLDIAWPELIVIGIVATVAIGPKDLPKVMNTMGKWVGKARMMASDIQRSMDQLSVEAEAAQRVTAADAAPASAQPATTPAADAGGIPLPAAAPVHAKHHPALHPAPPAAKDEPHDHLGST